MQLLSPFKDALCRALARKWLLLFYLCLFLLSTVCGIVFIKTPSFFEYHLRLCDRFLDRVCYSDRSVFLIFLERAAGSVLYVVLVFSGGFHPVLTVLPAAFVSFRAYTFGGTLAVFFSVYEFSGALVALTLYLPIHLLIDCVLFLAAALAFSHAVRFPFCAADLRALACDLLLCAACAVLVCLAEMVLLAALFHPLGNLL